MNRLHFFLPLLLTAALPAQDTAEPFDFRPATVVLYNESVPDSVELAKYYAEKRGIPPENLVGVKCPKDEIISREAYTTQIETPLREAFVQRKWWSVEKVEKEGLLATKTVMRVIAIMQGIPLGIGEAPKMDAKGQPVAPAQGESNAACVDSELTLLGALEHDTKSFIPNPYWNSQVPFQKFTITPVYLVGRIDGPDKATPRRLIDDAIAVERDGLYGKAYVDLARKTDAGYKQGEDALVATAGTLEMQGVPVIMDTWAPTLVTNFPLHDCAYYAGWYTGHADGPFLNPAFRFRRGAVACHIHSFSAGTLRKSNQNWCGPLLAKGACATLGNVFEPYLPLCASLDVFTERLFRGWNIAEAGWASARGLSWMSTVIGDPLYRPFAKPPGAGDKKKDADYKALRLAMQTWGKPEQKAERMKNFERAAVSLKSAAIYEFMGLHAQGGDTDIYNTYKAAKPWLEAAEALAKDRVDAALITFLKADSRRRDGDERAAAKMLTEFAEKYPGTAEAVAARALAQQIKGAR